jgi:hypothetical protein
MNRDWLDDATCAKLELDNSVFFPTNKAHFTAELMEMCLDCPVRMSCINHIATRETAEDSTYFLNGFFGGLSPDDRRILYKATKANWKTLSEKMIKDKIELRKDRDERKKRHYKKKKIS